MIITIRRLIIIELYLIMEPMWGKNLAKMRHTPTMAILSTNTCFQLWRDRTWQHERSSRGTWIYLLLLTWARLSQTWHAWPVSSWYRVAEGTQSSSAGTGISWLWKPAGQLPAGCWAGSTGNRHWFRVLYIVVSVTSSWSGSRVSSQSRLIDVLNYRNTNEGNSLGWEIFLI